MSKKANSHKPPSWTDLRLPLYRLYQQVQKLDRESGHATVDTQSYLLLLETLRRGYMLNSPDELFLLCEKLWLKPCHLPSAPLNRAKLHQLFEAGLQDFFSEAPPSSPPPAPPPLQPKKGSGDGSRKDSPPILPAPDKPPAPTEFDKAMTQQQGAFNVTVAAAPASSGSTSLTGPEEGGEDTGKEFLVKGTYLPVNPRRLEQSIRSYRYRLKGHGKNEIDWNSTAADIARKGYFDRFVYREQDVFHTGWTVLIDHSASMAAFHAYSEEIANAVYKGNAGGGDSIFYFQNYPRTHLFFNRLQSASLSLERFADGPRRNILVISDAGAARGSVSEERIRGTVQFLQRVQKHRIAWMNPMPRPRWENTSAELIAGYTDMFDIGEESRDSLSTIVRLFKSKITPEK